ncbi:MAG: M20/M25/M40 family metallo-hydrolase [Fuerstiella sp.]|nr:M20/M25/M40 family metallo-hydrolase [Fuerstiella sp.]MCP4506533.1 M20/M25/M40 family metallo-hydrolase [Fuerstiella sp.]
MKRFLLLVVSVCVLIGICAPPCPSVAAAESRNAVLERVGDDIRYLASDELEGRGIQTTGIHLAADRIITDYKQARLKPGMPDGSYKQSFEVQLRNTVSNDTSVVLKSPAGTTLRLKVKEQFQPLRRGKNGSAAGALVFVGYGITSTEDDFDEYKDVDVAGKVLVMIRREPHQDRADGAFQGTTTTEHSYINRKLELAKEHNAAGVIFVNDPHTVRDNSQDELSDPTGFGTEDSGIGFVHVRQTVIDQLLQKTPITATHDGVETKLATLREVAEFIDTTLNPVSQSLPGWHAEIATKFDSRSVIAHNLIGILEGEGDLADETIVVGAHYDHLGYGGYGSRAKNRKGEIHNGADDNATGTAAVLEIVRRMSGGPAPRRRIVFICFSGEERGLLGSKHYVDSPIVPLKHTVAMLNYDMIGTLRNNRVEVNGVGTATEFRSVVEAANESSPLDVTIVEHPFAGSDHLPFFQRQIPVMFCFTGVTSRYHTPDDDFETINVDGVVSVIDYTEQLLRGIDSLRTAPEFKNVSRRARTRRIPFLGIAPNLDGDEDNSGVAVRSVRPDSPAAAAGLQVGDVIVKIQETDIKQYTDLIQFLQASQAGQQLRLSIARGDEELELQATLGQPR